MEGTPVYHNSHDVLYRQPFGAVETGTSVTLRLRVDKFLGAKSVLVRLWHSDSEHQVPMREAEACGKELYEAEFRCPDQPGLVWYSFLIDLGNEVFHYCDNSERTGGPGRLLRHLANSYQITVYERGFTTPEWFRDSIVYQIMVDRFYKADSSHAQPQKKNAVVHENWDDIPCYMDGNGFAQSMCNDFFGGNLRGVKEKLPYLKSLGVKALYLNPIFEASSNHKYDTGDYMRIDPMFGNEQDFTELCEEARKAGISIILDGVFSHTGSDSVYFNKDGHYDSVGAYQSADSPYRSWYKFKGDSTDYDCWWGIKTLPNVDELNPSYLEFILTGEDSVVKYWLRQGASGWRLDVADELPDEFLEQLRTSAKSAKPESVIIGEVWEDASNKVSYGDHRGFLWGRQLDSVMNYPFREMVLSFLRGHSIKDSSHFDAETLHRKLMNLYENYPKPAFYALLNLIGSHDVARAKTVLGEAPPEHSQSSEQRAAYTANPPPNELGKRRLKLAALMQMTFPGVPCIYYGDEAGVEGYRDPLNRRTYPWGHEDRELIEWYRLLTGIRNKHACLRTGEWFSPYHKGAVYALARLIKDGSDVFGLKRDNGAALICVNRDPDNSHHIEFDASWMECGEVVNALDGNSIPIVNGRLSIDLAPLQGFILLRNEQCDQEELTPETCRP